MSSLSLDNLEKRSESRPSMPNPVRLSLLTPVLKLDQLPLKASILILKFSHQDLSSSDLLLPKKTTWHLSEDSKLTLPMKRLKKLLRNMAKLSAAPSIQARSKALSTLLPPFLMSKYSNNFR